MAAALRGAAVGVLVLLLVLQVVLVVAEVLLLEGQLVVPRLLESVGAAWLMGVRPMLVVVRGRWKWVWHVGQ